MSLVGADVVAGALSKNLTGICALFDKIPVDTDVVAGALSKNLTGVARILVRH